ncbi:hypothetical protein [Streptomyces sp. NPDC007100]|uniref:hypothetical protein n=1 Tax=Streptomyces sp. NPDC007100 TaxID=3155602 RepID=UPI0033EF4AEF
MRGTWRTVSGVAGGLLSAVLTGLPTAAAAGQDPPPSSLYAIRAAETGRCLDVSTEEQAELVVVTRRCHREGTQLWMRAPGGIRGHDILVSAVWPKLCVTRSGGEVGASEFTLRPCGEDTPPVRRGAQDFKHLPGSHETNPHQLRSRQHGEYLLDDGGAGPVVGMANRGSTWGFDRVRGGGPHATRA